LPASIIDHGVRGHLGPVVHHAGKLGINSLEFLVGMTTGCPASLLPEPAYLVAELTTRHALGGLGHILPQATAATKVLAPISTPTTVSSDPPVRFTTGS
jgi:hypothetical protein